MESFLKSLEEQKLAKRTIDNHKRNLGSCERSGESLEFPKIVHRASLSTEVGILEAMLDRK